MYSLWVWQVKIQDGVCKEAGCFWVAGSEVNLRCYRKETLYTHIMVTSSFKFLESNPGFGCKGRGCRVAG